MPSTVPSLMWPAPSAHSTTRKLSGTKDLLRRMESLGNKSSYAFVRTLNKIVNSKKTWRLTGVTSPGGATRSLSSMDAKILTRPARADLLRVNSPTPSWPSLSILPSALSLRSSDLSNSPKTSLTSLTPLRNSLVYCASSLSHEYIITCIFT